MMTASLDGDILGKTNMIVQSHSGMEGKHVCYILVLPDITWYVCVLGTIIHLLQQKSVSRAVGFLGGQASTADPTGKESGLQGHDCVVE